MPIKAAMDGLAPAGPGPVTGPRLDNRRVLAALIDLALLVPVALLMSALFGGFTAGAELLTIGWGLYYYFALESSGGQTLGKRLMKIRVARADGGPLDLGRVAVRTLLRPIDGIGAYLVGLVVMLATGERRQRLGDLAAGTVVTEAAFGAPATPAAAPEISVEPESMEPAPAGFGEPFGGAEPRHEEPPELKPFEPFSEPDPDPEVEPVAEEPAAAEAPPAEEIVPVDRPAEAEATEPVEEPVPVPETEPEDEEAPDEPTRLEIVTSPIELVMDEQDKQDDESAEDPPPPASA